MQKSGALRSASRTDTVTPPEAGEAAELVVHHLEQIGIRHVFGIPGGAIEPLFDALARSERRGGPRVVVARHEAGAAFMADGYARETGDLGVCCATSGPGATNLITGVACAYDNGIPLLVLTGQPALPLFGKRALQESTCTGVDVLAMFAHCTRYSSLVSHVDQLEHKLLSALLRATQEPRGPVHLSVPVDILRTRAARRRDGLGLSLRGGSALVDRGAVQELHQILRASRRTVLLVGRGARDAADLVVRFAELARCPFVTTPDAKGLVDPRHPLYWGVFGFAGHARATEAIASIADVVLVVGTRLGEWTSGAWHPALLSSKLVHVDGDDEHLLLSPMARLHVKGSIRPVFELLIALQGSRRAERPRRIEAPARGGIDTVAPARALPGAEGPVRPEALMSELSCRFPAETRFVADAGNSAAWAIHCLELADGRARPAARRRPAADPRAQASDLWERVVRLPGRSHRGAGWLSVLAEFAPMGWAIGASIGIARANPGCPVACLTGDGSYLMSGQEITVAAQEGLTVVFVILNDASLGMVKHGQRLAGAERTAFELPRVDYRRLAEAMGIPGRVIRTQSDLEALDVDAILAGSGPTLLDVHIDGEAVPPIGLRLQTLETHE